MPGEEAGPRASLLDMPGMCVEDGPSLSLARNLCWIEKLQGLSPVPHIHDIILLSLLLRFGNLGLAGAVK